jgi:hypothetical protein
MERVLRFVQVLSIVCIPIYSYSPQIAGNVQQQNTMRRYTATHVKYADLTPAVDKFPRVPSIDLSSSQYLITAKGPMPQGPEPFGLVSDDLQPLADYVKELVVSENPVLTMAASHFFEKVCV